MEILIEHTYQLLFVFNIIAAYPSILFNYAYLEATETYGVMVNV